MATSDTAPAAAAGQGARHRQPIARARPQRRHRILDAAARWPQFHRHPHRLTLHAERPVAGVEQVVTVAVPPGQVQAPTAAVPQGELRDRPGRQHPADHSLIRCAGAGRDVEQEPDHRRPGRGVRRDTPSPRRPVQPRDRVGAGERGVVGERRGARHVHRGRADRRADRCVAPVASPRLASTPPGTARRSAPWWRGASWTNGSALALAVEAAQSCPAAVTGVQMSRPVGSHVCRPARSIRPSMEPVGAGRRTRRSRRRPRCCPARRSASPRPPSPT